jgi:hypothetical protein
MPEPDARVAHYTDEKIPLITGRRGELLVVARLVAMALASWALIGLSVSLLWLM